MNLDDVTFVKKTVIGYKTLSEENKNEVTNVVISIDQYRELKKELYELSRKEIDLSNSLKDINTRFNDNVSYSRNLFSKCEDLRLQLANKQNELDESITKREKLKAICNSFVRQCKDRSNQEKEQFPKKQHTGYSLVSSNPKDYQYIKGGNRKKVAIFESIFQTPYLINFDYYEAYDLVDQDLCFGEEDDQLLDYMGADNITYKTRYEELFDEYKSEQIENNNIFYNQNIRMNGRDGYWELVINHTKPLKSPPMIMRFSKRFKEKGKKKNE